MIELKKLGKITLSDLESMGLNGYRTDRIFTAGRSSSASSVKFDLVEDQLQEEYVKNWRQTEDTIEYFQEVIDQGYSIGAYKNGVLVGFALLSYYGWNNSMWIENIRVSEEYQGQGIGGRLIDRLIEVSREKKARILGLETQSTNYPAVVFYKKCGFEISGIDFARYPQRENDFEQVAILMKIDITG